MPLVGRDDCVEVPRGWLLKRIFETPFCSTDNYTVSITTARHSVKQPDVLTLLRGRLQSHGGLFCNGKIVNVDPG